MSTLPTVGDLRIAAYEHLARSWYYYNVFFVEYLGHIDGVKVKRCATNFSHRSFTLYPDIRVSVEDEPTLRTVGAARPFKYLPDNVDWSLESCTEAVATICEYIRSLKWSEIHLQWVRLSEHTPVPNILGVNTDIAIAMEGMATPKIVPGQCPMCFKTTPFSLKCFWSHYCCEECLDAIITTARRRHEAPRCPHCRAPATSLKYAYCPVSPRTPAEAPLAPPPRPTEVAPVPAPERHVPMVDLTSPIPAAIHAANDLLQLAPHAHTTQEDDDEDTESSSDSEESVEIIEEQPTSLRLLMRRLREEDDDDTERRVRRRRDD